MSYKLFLDDERYPPDNAKNWKIVRNYNDFIFIIFNEGLPDFISFDHDLGNTSLSGYDCAKWLVNYCIDNKLVFNCDFYVHSQNPVGKANIEGLLENFKYVKYV